MKTVIHVFVVALALTGAVASTQISAASIQAKVVSAKTSAFPVPMCDPNDPNACGIDGM